MVPLCVDLPQYENIVPLSALYKKKNRIYVKTSALCSLTGAAGALGSR